MRKPPINGVETGYIVRPGVKVQKCRQDLVLLLKDTPSLAIREYDNSPIARSRFPFDYQKAPEPKLRALREAYNLAEVTGRGRSEFDRMVRLREWVKSRWAHGAPKAKNHASLDALQMLRRAEDGEQFFCHHYSVTFIQCCLALGWQARFVSTSTSGPFGHSVAEVWSNEYAKWVVMDTDYNIHYTRDGVPLNALELHNAWLGSVQDVLQNVEVVEGVPRPHYIHRNDVLYHLWHLLNYYFRFAVIMGNSFFGKGRKSSVLADVPAVRWYDDRTPRRARAQGKAACDTNRADDLYWPLNRTHISLTPLTGENGLRVFLNTLTPCFRGFEVRLDRGNWMPSDRRFTWALHPGVNTLEARSVNSYGCSGIAGRVSLVCRRAP